MIPALAVPVRRFTLLLAALGLLLTVGLTGAGDARAEKIVVSGGVDERPKHALKATIRRTKYGVPHIRARDIESLAAGYAFAYAEDNICTIANEYVTVSAERSRYFGPDETWYFSGNGTTYRNLDADFYFEWVKQRGVVRQLMKQPPPGGPKRGVRAGVKGYVAGYNAYLKKVGVDGIKDRTCRGADWVRPIKQIDVFRRFYQLGILGSSGAVIDGIVNAAPTSPARAAAADRERARQLESGEGLDALQPDIGSNAYGFGGDATENGRGLVLGNPHFPWDGAERLYQAHLQIPGKVNVSGGSLNGVPLILIGNTRGLAWSHTVATAWRFTPFKLQLAPGDPYSYIVDGVTKPMDATAVTVKAKTEGGDLEDRSKTIYSTEYGPMINDLVRTVPLPWTEGSGFALADVNATNFRYLNHFFENNKAQTVREYHEIQNKYQGIPWVNSLAADSTGEAYYSMQGAIPYVTDEKSAECNVAEAGFEVVGLPILDGSRSSCNWDSSPDAAAPGTFPPDEVPSLFRDDYVHNGNDSHWLTNPDQPLTGFDRIIGPEDAERTLRTRLGLVQVEDRLAGTDGLPGKLFNAARLRKIMLGNRQYAGELWRDALVTLCGSPVMLGSAGARDMTEECAAIRGWDGLDELDSTGGLLFRRFVVKLFGQFRSVPTGLQGSTRVGMESVWTTPFSAADAVHTPSGLDIANPLVAQSFVDAAADLDADDMPYDARLGDFQGDVRGGEFVPIFGGPGGAGVFNAINVGRNPGNISHGSSFIMVAQFTGKKCPVSASTFVTYGQTENQRSRHASDYTKAFSNKKWNDVPFCRDEVKRATLSKDSLIVRPRPGRRTNR